MLFKKVNRETTSVFEKIVVQYLEQKIVRNNSSCERQVEKPATGAAAAKGRNKGTGKTVDIAYNGQQKGQCSRGDMCKSKGIGEGFAIVQLSATDFRGNRTSTRKSDSGHESKHEAGSEPQKRKNSVVVAKTLGRTQAEEKITSLKLNEKGDFLHGVTGIPEIYNKEDNAVEVRMLFRVTNSEVFQIS